MQTCLQTLQLFNCMDSTTIHIANIGTDMPTNPTIVQLYINTHGFYGNSRCKPWRRHVYKPYQLFNCTYTCMDSMANHIANLGTDMLTNPTVDQLHEKCMDSTTTHITKLGTDMITNPISCSIVHKRAGILWRSTLQTLAQTYLQTLQLFDYT